MSEPKAITDSVLIPGEQGKIKLTISHNEGFVRIDFGRPVGWFALPKSEALTFAFAILENCGVTIEHKVEQPPAKGEPA